jgi:hypothetical protein
MKSPKHLGVELRKNLPRRIAILAWDGAVWNADGLRLLDGVWRYDGPLLPVDIVPSSKQRFPVLLCDES